MCFFVKKLFDKTGFCAIIFFKVWFFHQELYFRGIILMDEHAVKKLEDMAKAIRRDIVEMIGEAKPVIRAGPYRR